MQAASLPGGDFLQHGISRRADQAGRPLHPVRLAQVTDDFPYAMPRAGIDTILSSKPGKRFWCLANSFGSKVGRRSRGISSSNVPVSVITMTSWIVWTKERRSGRSGPHASPLTSSDHGASVAPAKAGWTHTPHHSGPLNSLGAQTASVVLDASLSIYPQYGYLK